MKLLVVDHNALDAAHRVLYAKMVERGGIELRLVVPFRWFNNFRFLSFSPPEQQLPYDLFACDVLFPTRTHRLIYRRLSDHLKQFQPDVFYINAEPENFQTFQAAKLCASRNITLVFSSWRNIDHMQVGYPYKCSFLHRAIERYVLRRASHGIVFNRSAQHLFSRHGYHATSVIPPSVDTQVFYPRARNRQDQCFVIGYVGRLTKGKGVDLLLHALAGLPPSYRATIVGDGPMSESLKQLASRLGSRVAFKPPVSSEELPTILSAFDGVVLPSRSMRHWREQFGRILIEAMACGVPVIGSTSGEIPDVIGDAGLVFKEESVEGLRLGLERLAQDERLRDELRERGLRRVREKYEVTRVAQQMHSLFIDLARLSTSRSAAIH